MTRTISAPTSTPPMPAAIPVPRLAPQRRWRPGLVALAVALIATGGLSAAYAVSLVGSTNAYLAVAHEVQAGSQIAQADLTVVRISTDPALRPMPADRLSNVVGKYAAVALFPGALLTEGQLTDVGIGETAGIYLVTIGVPQERVPAQRIRPGVKVLLVATQSESLGYTETDEPTETFQGTVIGIANGTQPGRYLVEVAVADGDAPRIATLNAANQISIVLTGG